MTRTNEFGQTVGEPVAWRGATRPGRTALGGAYVDLVPVTAEHGRDLLAGACEPWLWTYRPDEPPRDQAEAERCCETWASATASVTWAIVPRPSGRLEGVVSWMRIEPAQGSVEVAAVLYGERLQRTRAATETQHLLMRHAFDDLGHRRYEWKCDSLNEPSRRAAVRYGFTYEGRFRNAMVYKGRNRDTDWFSVTDADWPAVRAGFEAWLAADNFDGDGRQRRTLTECRSQPLQR
jgi:RimJ/RimL family protein N-acetyltransferase